MRPPSAWRRRRAEPAVHLTTTRPCARPRLETDPMTANVYYTDDADPSLLQGKTVAIIGYGSQGHGHALNLKDSGVDVIVGLRPDSSSVAGAREAGLEVTEVAEAASRG